MHKFSHNLPQRIYFAFYFFHRILTSKIHTIESYAYPVHFEEGRLPMIVCTTAKSEDGFWEIDSIPLLIDKKHKDKLKKIKDHYTKNYSRNFDIKYSTLIKWL